jgi:hypothetical protein
MQQALQNALAQRAQGVGPQAAPAPAPQPQPVAAAPAAPAGNDDAAWNASRDARSGQPSRFSSIMHRLAGSPGGGGMPQGGPRWGGPQFGQAQPGQPVMQAQPMPVRPQIMQPGMAMAAPQQPQMPPQNALMQRANGMVF